MHGIGIGNDALPFKVPEAQRYFRAYQPTPANQQGRNVTATLQNGVADTREVAISAHLTQTMPGMVDFDFLDSIIRLGCELLDRWVCTLSFGRRS
jgi:hypothetical protein